MNAADAAKVAAILANADGQCISCARALAREAEHVFPDHDWIRMVAAAGGWDREELEPRR
jgi:hypothetical protein